MSYLLSSFLYNSAYGLAKDRNFVPVSSEIYTFFHVIRKIILIYFLFKSLFLFLSFIVNVSFKEEIEENSNGNNTNIDLCDFTLNEMSM